MKAWIELLKNTAKKQPAYRLFIAGFLGLIAAGTLLLLLPFSVHDGKTLTFLDAGFTATSAVCVTGLVVVDTAGTFTLFGRTVILLLIQVGGLGIAFAGATLFLLAGKRIGFKSRLLVKEALNVENTRGLISLVKNILCITFCFEGIGAVLSFAVFIRDYPLMQAIEISIFHSVASFCNAGFDILGGFGSLAAYQNNLLLKATTAALVFFGGIGFFVILDVLNRRSFRKLNLHSKITITTSLSLVVIAAMFLWLTEDIPLTTACFYSISARTAGFSTCSLNRFSGAGIFMLILLMFIGASSGSTGGGIKTSTLFVILSANISYVTNRPCNAFKRKISDDIVQKAFIVFSLSLLLICTGTAAMCVLEPEYSLVQILFEVVSAFGTVGLSMGITPELGVAAKLLLIALMFIGRVGVLTIAFAWIYKPPAKAMFSQEYISIG